jgi:hypothetical protein
VPDVFCINCGEALAPDHRYCPKCGAERFTPREAPLIPRPPPGAGTQPFRPPPPRAEGERANLRLRWLPFVFAAGAVFWLIELVQFAAVLAAPAGRDQLRQALISAGVKQNLDSVIVAESAVVVLFEGAAVALHAAAYFGLRKLRPWGWIAAVIVSAGWSLLLVGIPVLVILMRRSTREAFGIS